MLYTAVEVFLSKKFFRLFLHEICICTPSLLSTDDFQLICHYFLTNSFKCNNVSLFRFRLYSIIIDCMINFLKVFFSYFYFLRLWLEYLSKQKAIVIYTEKVHSHITTTLHFHHIKSIFVQAQAGRLRIIFLCVQTERQTSSFFRTLLAPCMRGAFALPAVAHHKKTVLVFWVHL